MTRRNSLTTLHSLPVSTEDEELRSVKKIGLGRQTTVPHGYNVSAFLRIIYRYAIHEKYEYNVKYNMNSRWICPSVNSFTPLIES